jgi:hypothetical protein
VHEVKLKLIAGSGPDGLLVVNRKGVILHTSPGLAASLADSGTDATGRRDGLSPMALFKGLPGSGMVPSAARGGTPSSSPLLMGVEQLAGFTLCDFVPSPWKEMHLKYLKVCIVAG